MHITEQIMAMDAQQAYEAACENLGYPVLNLEHFSNYPENMREEKLARYMIECANEALNKLGDWESDHEDSSQLKYYPWLWKKPGVGWVLYRVTYVNSGTCVGARLESKNEAQVEWLVKTFSKQYAIIAGK